MASTKVLDRRLARGEFAYISAVLAVVSSESAVSDELFEPPNKYSALERRATYRRVSMLTAQKSSQWMKLGK